jgi:hypothetical protein
MAPLNALVPTHPVLDAPVVRAAYAAAARAHAGQARRSGEPVLSHCLATAEILAGLGLPEEAVAAGLLHDVLSDTRLTAAQLEEHVPRSCVELVRGATPPAGLGLGLHRLRPVACARPATRSAAAGAARRRASPPALWPGSPLRPLTPHPRPHPHPTPTFLP